MGDGDGAEIGIRAFIVFPTPKHQNKSARSHRHFVFSESSCFTYLFNDSRNELKATITTM